jgi:hypothetical protein
VKAFKTTLLIAGISSIYTIRGLAFILILLQETGLIESTDSIPPAEPGSSLVSLFVGLMLLAGTLGLWSSLKQKS